MQKQALDKIAHSNDGFEITELPFGKMDNKVLQIDKITCKHNFSTVHYQQYWIKRSNEGAGMNEKDITKK